MYLARFPWRLRMSRALLLAIVFVTACSGTFLTEERASDDPIVTVDGPLRLTVSDTPSQMGVFWALPFATATQSAMSVTNTRYGSTCQYALSGHADVGSSSITLLITFAERLTSCTKEVRALSYRADISGLAKGPYDVVVIHDQSGNKQTVLTQHIVVP
jgi:hypothetical protein